MHELSIAAGIVDVACEELSRLGARRAQAVHLRVGHLSGVVTHALLFCFDAAAAGTPLEGARLQIEEVTAVAWCSRCSAERSLDRVMHRRCPVCGAAMPELLAGRELEIVALEVIDP
jgi:hydrogenase nickel incorporation protein HypA/HybF